MSGTICFDFDGVLAAYDGWNGGVIGEPLKSGVELVKLCKTKGYRIIISTCRTHPDHGPGNQTHQINMVHEWLLDNKIPYDWLDVVGKPIADVYVDDRGLHFKQDLGDNIDYAEDLFYRIVRRIEG